MTTRLISPGSRVATVLLAILFFATASFAGGVAGAPASPSEMLANHISSMHPIALPGVAIENFGVIDGHIYRGAQPGAKDYAALASIGVKTIIDLRNDAKESSRGNAEAAGLHYINIGIDVHGQPSDAQVREFLKDIDDPANGVVYVHCAGGQHRTGAMIAIYRMVHDGWKVDQAYTEMLAYRFYAAWGHEGFKTYVKDYYHRMTTDPSSVPVAYKPAASGSALLASGGQ